MIKILSIFLLAMLSGCASQSAVTEIDDKMSAIHSQIDDLSSRVDFLSKKQSTNMIHVNDKILQLTRSEETSFTHLAEGIEELRQPIEHHNQKRILLSNKIHKMSKKLFPRTTKSKK
jgi:hypothetical protein